MPTVEQLRKAYKNDKTYRLQVDDLVKKSKTNYGVQLTKEDVFKAVSSDEFVRDYAEKKKKAAKKPTAAKTRKK